MITIRKNHGTTLLFPFINWKRILVYFVSIAFHLQIIDVASASIPSEDDIQSAHTFQEGLGAGANRTNASGYLYESYQRSIQCTSSLPPLKPKTLKEIQEIVQDALQKNYHIKAVGSLHSATDIICTSGLMLDMKHITHFSLDPETNLATVGAGMELQDFLERLHEKGRALRSAPVFGGITIGGAVGAGVHGTTLKQAAILSDQIVSLTFVDGLGNVRTLSSGEEDFKAFKVHLGLLGIIFELVVETTDQYKVEVRNFPISDDILWKRRELTKIAEDNDMFQFWWFPSNKQIVMSFGNMVPANTSGNCETHLVTESTAVDTQGIKLSLELMQAAGDDVGFFFVQSFSKISLFTEVPGRTAMYTKADGYTSCLPTAVGYSHRMMTNRCKECYWNQGEYSFLVEDASISIPLRELPEALKTLRAIFDKQLTGFPLTGIWVRFVKGSDAYMAMNSNRDSVVFEWNTAPRYDRSQPRLGVTAYLAMAQALIEKHGGRPHWAKNGLYYSNPKIVQRSVPELQKFVQVMNKMDPYEVFMNDFGKRIKYGSTDMTVSKETSLRCALNEACLCKDDLDCGNGGEQDFVCDRFMEYRVCKKNPNPVDDIKDTVSKNVIKLAADLSNNIEYVMNALSNYKGFGIKK